MKYPKEAINQACLASVDAFECRMFAEYAQWAHEQLRPRKMSQEEPPEVCSYLVWLPRNKVWSPHSGKICLWNCWLPMPPPPEDDGFEEWVESHPEMDPPNLWKTRLQECWQAAQWAMRKDKE